MHIIIGSYLLYAAVLYYQLPLSYPMWAGNESFAGFSGVLGSSFICGFLAALCGCRTLNFCLFVCLILPMFVEALCCGLMQAVAGTASLLEGLQNQEHCVSGVCPIRSGDLSNDELVEVP